MIIKNDGYSKRYSDLQIDFMMKKSTDQGVACFSKYTNFPFDISLFKIQKSTLDFPILTQQTHTHTHILSVKSSPFQFAKFSSQSNYYYYYYYSR